MTIPKRAYVLIFFSALSFILYSLIDFLYLFTIPYQLEMFIVIFSRIALPISLISFVSSILIILKSTLNDRKLNKTPDNDIERLRNRLFGESSDKEKNKDILELMLTNMSEIKQYYSISKKHAQLSFVLALVFCIFGFVLLAYAISIDKENQQPIIIGLIGGTVSELFAGTALFVHKSSLAQLNHYYKSLHENEKFLSTVNLIDRLSDDKQDEAILKVIDSSLKDISSLIKRSDD